MTNKNIHIFYVEIWGGDISTYRIMFICRIRLSFIKLVDVWRFVRPVGLQLIKTSWYFCSWWTTVVTNNDGQRRVNTISLIAPRHTKSDRKRERERERERERGRERKTKCKGNSDNCTWNGRCILYSIAEIKQGYSKLTLGRLLALHWDASYSLAV